MGRPLVAMALAWTAAGVAFADTAPPSSAGAQAPSRLRWLRIVVGAPEERRDRPPMVWELLEAEGRIAVADDLGLLLLRRSDGAVLLDETSGPETGTSTTPPQFATWSMAGPRIGACRGPARASFLGACGDRLLWVHGTHVTVVRFEGETAHREKMDVGHDARGLILRGDGVTVELHLRR